MLIKRPVQTVAPVPPPPPPAINKATVESSQKDEVDALLASFHPKQGTVLYMR